VTIPASAIGAVHSVVPVGELTSNAERAWIGLSALMLFAIIKPGALPQAGMERALGAGSTRFKRRQVEMITRRQSHT
jgi:hypothetical protein